MIFNKLLAITQEKSVYLFENSLFLQNIDKLILVCISAVFLCSTFASSDTLGFIALVTLFLTVIKLFLKKGEKIEFNAFDTALLIYFIFVVISLAGSTLFALSFKGFLKTFLYLGFYFSLSQFFKENKAKIPYLFALIGICLTAEGIFAIAQNFWHFDQISTWQDVTNLNPEEVMTRVWGTLKPYNPNLLGGYFVAGLPVLFGFSAFEFFGKHYKTAIISLVCAGIATVGLVLTGSRGAYLGLLTIVVGIFLVAAKFLWDKHKKMLIGAVTSVVAFGTLAIISTSALRARVLSMFAMRADSSNSFRFNVYHSSFNMFKDNWLLGIGCGNQNFREIYGLYMRTGFDALSTYNVMLEIAVESGIFALISFISFVVMVFVDGIKFVLKSENAQNVVLCAAALISIAAVMVHGLVDTIFFRPQVQFLFWLMVAVVKTSRR